MLTRIILKDLLTCFQLNWGLRLQPWTAASLVYVCHSCAAVSKIKPCWRYPKSSWTHPDYTEHANNRQTFPCYDCPNWLWCRGLCFFSILHRHGMQKRWAFCMFHAIQMFIPVLRCIGSLCWPSKSHHPVCVWITSFLPSLIFHVTCQLTQL